MIACLNKSYLEGEDESMVKAVIGNEAMVTHTSWERVMFATSVVSQWLSAIDTLCSPPPPKYLNLNVMVLGGGAFRRWLGLAAQSSWMDSRP